MFVSWFTRGEKMEAEAVVVVLKLGLVSSSVTVWVECWIWALMELGQWSTKGSVGGRGCGYFFTVSR